MALKALMLKRKIELAQKALAELRDKDAEFATREAELEASIAEVETDEERATVDEAVASYEADKAAHDEAVGNLEEELRGLETELSEVEEKQDVSVPDPADDTNNNEERKVDKVMETRTRFSSMTMEQRSAFVKREDVATWLSNVRALKGQQRSITNGDLTIPEVVLPLLYSEAENASQLMSHVNLKQLRGTSRQNIMGAIPEAVWTEMCANINELDLGFNDVELDGYKVAGFIKICNALLEDSDINLADEIITALGAAIGKALDKAILFGTGVKMPLGIATRLAQTSQPAGYPAKAPTWVDLHTTNVLTLNINGTSGAAFFESLVLAAAAAKKNGLTGGKLFWAMNRKTHLTLMAKALAFNAAAALTAGINNEMPVIGGQIVEIDTIDMQDNEIIGGFGEAYVLAQRQGATFGISEHAFFTEDQTAFKGVARYDGQPVFANSFVVINFNNTSPTTTASFADDYANTALGTLTVTAAQGGTAGKTVLTVTGTEASGTTLKYKIGNIELTEGKKLGTGWTSLTSGTTNIEAAAGTVITVAELDGNSRVIKRGDVISVPKTSG